MTTAIYIVVFAQDKWWIDYDGAATGPFTSMEVAMASAVSLAGSAARAGKRSEVRVSGPGYRNRIVYQSPERSALSRAAALLETH